MHLTINVNLNLYLNLKADSLYVYILGQLINSFVILKSEDEPMATVNGPHNRIRYFSYSMFSYCHHFCFETIHFVNDWHSGEAVTLYHLQCAAFSGARQSCLFLLSIYEEESEAKRRFIKSSFFK